MADAPEVKRGLFGYRKGSVQALLADRERMFLEISEAARSAEGRLEVTGKELEQVKADLDAVRRDLDARTAELASAQTRQRQLESDLAAATSQLAEQGQRTRDTEQRLHARERSLLERIEGLQAELEEARAAPAGVGELTTVLDATREAVERIMSDARRSAEDQLAEMQRTRDELEADIGRATAWREHVAPLIDGVRREIGRTQAEVVQVGARVSDALRPMTDVLSTLGRSLEELERAAAPQIPPRLSVPDRVDLVAHESSEAPEPPGADREPPARAVPETPAWRGGGQTWR